jgi:3-oxoacyl-[acyl-carrier protein] reductase
MRSIRGKNAMVTGAASGIGRAIALALADRGAGIYLVDIDGAGLAEVGWEVRQRGAPALVDRCDLALASDVSRAAGSLLGRWGTLDILVNNAGIAYYGPTERMTAAQWDRLLAVNLLAPIHLTRLLLPALLERPESHLLNVCSIAGLVASGRLAAYHVSKFGLVGFSESLRAEYGRRGLGVTALCPGLVATNIFGAAMSGRSDRPVPIPPRWVCTTPEAVARRAIRAIRRNEGVVPVTWMAHVLWRLKRFTPGLLDLAQRFGRRRSKPAAREQLSPAAGATDPPVSPRRAA